jgi:hypothetical protein
MAEAIICDKGLRVNNPRRKTQLGHDFFTNYLAITILPAIWIISIISILFGIFTPTLLDRIISFTFGIPLLLIGIYLTKKWYEGL